MGRDVFFSRLRDTRDVTVTAIRDAMVEHVPAYAALRPARHVTLLGEVHEMWDAVLNRAQVNEPLTEADLDIFRAVARARARDAFPLHDLRAGLGVSYVAGLRTCFSYADAGDGEEPSVFTAWGVREQPRVVQIQTDAFLAARADAGDTMQARDLLVRHLLEGESTAAAAEAAGVVLPEGYLMLLCRLQQPAELDQSVQLAVVERTLGTVPGVLWQGDLLRGKLLILLPSETDPAVARVAAGEVIAALARIVGQRLHTAEAYAPSLRAVPEAFQEAQQAITLVAAMPDAKSRPYRTDELLIELAVARQPALQRRLADLLAPLRQGTDLLRTLQVLFDCGLDREKATRALYIHRRTLTYRIQRIRDLTGLDPTTAHGIQLLRTALTATRLAR